MLYFERSSVSFRFWQRHAAFAASVVMVLMVVWVGSLEAAWLLKRSADGSEERAVCHLESEARTVNDGYDDIQTRLIVSTDVVQVVSEAPLDTEFADIGLRIDHHPFVEVDAVNGRKHAQFKTPYADLVKGFRKGHSVRAQLRFWPTWPATGTHSVLFSLRGFSKA